MSKLITRAAFASLCTITLATSLPACAVESEEDVASASDGIVNGTLDSGHPAVVQVIMEVAPKNYGACTGTLIAPRLVLTAAHCVVSDGGTNKNWAVYFGSVSKGKSLADYQPVETAYFHTGYKGIGTGKDVALLLLEKASNVKPMPITRTKLGAGLIGSTVTAVGFGMTRGGENDDGKDSMMKRAAAFRVSAMNATELKVSAPNRAICYGDSGGPLLSNANGAETVIGIASYTAANAAKECVGAGGYTRVDDVLDFIDAAAEIAGQPLPQSQPQSKPQPPPPSSAKPGALPVATTVSGALNGETDTFTFTASKARLAFTAEGDAEMETIDGQGGSTTVTAPQTQTITLGQTSTFTIKVRSPSGTAQRYTIRRD